MIVLDIQRLENTIKQIKDAVAEKEDISILADSIVSIKRAFESHWQENYIPFAEKILDKLIEGIPTPVLTVCGQGTREIRFTQYLAYYLDPSKDHGLGNILLKAVLGPVTKELTLDWANDCEVIPEIWIGNYFNEHGKKVGCNCDIGILSRNFVIMIEQKILSGEDTGKTVGLSQLQRYSEVLESNRDYSDKQVIKVFLTPSGRVPEKAKAIGWISMSYGDIIDNCYNVLKKGNLNITARENLRSLLVDLIIGPYEDTEDLIVEIKKLANSLVVGNYNLIDIVGFRGITDENSLLINVLMEG